MRSQQNKYKWHDAASSIYKNGTTIPSVFLYYFPSHHWILSGFTDSHPFELVKLPVDQLEYRDLRLFIIDHKKLWRIDHAHILQRAMQQDASKWIILFLVIITLIMCFIAFIIEINHLPQDTTIRTGHLILSVLTIISAWFLMHTIFAIHYAHDFYLALDKQQQGGLDFPNTTRPTYPDFLYFSYIIGTSAQTADVSITCQSMRVLNTLHLLLAYGFNTTILAISINVTANFIST